MTTSNAIRNPRVDWIDYAKGICIVMVVTLYATNYVHENARAIGWMHHVADFAQPFRMPDFYLLAGLFVARVVDRPLRSYIDGKVLYFMYFYALWVTIKFANMHAGDLLSAIRLDLLLEYLRLYIEPPTGPLWFIYILALFFITVRLVRRVPVVIVLPIAMALEMAVTTSSSMQLDIKLADKFARYFVFFYSGYVFSRYVFMGAAWAQARQGLTLAIVVLWFALNGLMVALDATFLPGMQLLMGYIGASAIMLASTLIARMPGMHWLAYLGQHSIVVYLGFVVPIGLMRRFIVSPLIADIGWLALTVTVLSVAGSIVLYWMVRNSPLRFLFERPAWTSIAGSRSIAAPKEIATQ